MTRSFLLISFFCLIPALFCGCEPENPVREHHITLITLSDGRQMKFVQGSPEIWNRAFLDSFTSETIRERINVSGCWVNNIYSIRTYRITPEIVALWEASVE